MIEGLPKLPAACDACGHHIRFEEIPGQTYRLLLDSHYHEHFAEELRMLEKVSEFYDRNPDAEGTIMRPPAYPPRVAEPHPDDAEVIDYLRWHTFALGPRILFVRAALGQTAAAVGQVRCPECENGVLHLTAPHGRGPGPV